MTASTAHSHLLPEIHQRAVPEAGSGALTMMCAIKRALDPDNILNPGKIFVL